MAAAIIGAAVGAAKSLEKQQQDNLNNQRIVDQARSSMYKTLINKKFEGAPVEDIQMSGSVEDIAKGATGSLGAGKDSIFKSLGKKKPASVEVDDETLSNLDLGKKKQINADAGIPETAVA